MEHINPVILVAVIVQSFISNVSRLTGAIAGYLITAGILIWGLGLYETGDGIALFGIPLSEEAFWIAVLVWFGFDTYELINAPKHGEPEESDATLDESAEMQ